MTKIYLNVACAGMDVHYKFSNVTFRDPGGKVVRRERLVHRHREELQERLNRWPTGIDYQPVPPARPGSDKNKKKSRSETGQLLHPMVHALTA